MCADTTGKKVVFRHGTFNSHPRLATGVFLCLLACLFVAALSARSWLGLTAVCALAVAAYASVAYVRFEIWDSGFSYRSLSGKHVFEFAQVEDALFETVHADEADAPVFSLRLRGDVRRKGIPIGMFPVQAGALLLNALGRYRIPIRQDGSSKVESLMQGIREASTEANINSR